MTSTQTSHDPISITVNILRFDAENWLGDTDGVDVDQTVANYADAVEARLGELYPNTTITVRILPQSTLSVLEPVAVECDECDGQMHTETVNDAMTDVFNGGFSIVMLDGAVVS